MATIITTGQLPGDKVLTTACRNCGTTFSFKRSEGTESADSQFGMYIAIACPLDGCGHSVVVPITMSENI
jgi:hypothetical protein